MNPYMLAFFIIGLLHTGIFIWALVMSFSTSMLIAGFCAGMCFLGYRYAYYNL